METSLIFSVFSQNQLLITMTLMLVHMGLTGVALINLGTATLELGCPFQDFHDWTAILTEVGIASSLDIYVTHLVFRVLR